MTPKAILFGAIGSLTETSELQRRAFNAAFNDADLDWNWSQSAYLKLLKTPGGKARIAKVAKDQGITVDAPAIHARKVDHFERLVRQEGIQPRPGVRELIDWARGEGIKLGFATSTTLDTVSLIFNGLSPEVVRSDFSFIGHRDLVEKSKPAPDIYKLAMKDMGVLAYECVAIEDTPESAAAALAAGIRTIGFPGEAAQGRSFPSDALTAKTLSRALFTTGWDSAAA